MTSLMDKLGEHSPDTAFERFAKNFRNMGVVTWYGRGAGDDTLVVKTDERGMDVTPVREKGHDFSLIQTYLELSGDEPAIVHVFEYRGGDDE